MAKKEAGYISGELILILHDMIDEPEDISQAELIYLYKKISKLIQVLDIEPTISQDVRLLLANKESQEND